MIQGMTSYLLKNTNKFLKIIKKLKSQMQQAILCNFSMSFSCQQIFVIIVKEIRNHWDGDHVSQIAMLWWNNIWIESILTNLLWHFDIEINIIGHS